MAEPSASQTFESSAIPAALDSHLPEHQNESLPGPILPELIQLPTELVDEIFYYLSYADLARVRSCSRALHRLVAAHTPRQCSVGRRETAARLSEARMQSNWYAGIDLEKAFRKYVRTWGLLYGGPESFALQYAHCKPLWDWGLPHTTPRDATWIKTLALLARFLGLLDNLNYWRMCATGDRRAAGTGRFLPAAAYCEDLDMKIRNTAVLLPPRQLLLHAWMYFNHGDTRIPRRYLHLHNAASTRVSPAAYITEEHWMSMISNIHNELLRGLPRAFVEHIHLGVRTALSRTNLDVPRATIDNKMISLGIMDRDRRRLFPLHSSTLKNIERWWSLPLAKRDELLRLHILEDMELDDAWTD